MKVYVLWIKQTFLNIKKVSATVLRHIIFVNEEHRLNKQTFQKRILETNCDEMNYDEEDIASGDPISVSQTKKVSAVSVAFLCYCWS